MVFTSSSFWWGLALHPMDIYCVALICLRKKWRTHSRNINSYVAAIFPNLPWFAWWGTLVDFNSGRGSSGVINSQMPSLHIKSTRSWGPTWFAIKITTAKFWSFDSCWFCLAQGFVLLISLTLWLLMFISPTLAVSQDFTSCGDHLVLKHGKL